RARPSGGARPADARRHHGGRDQHSLPHRQQPVGRRGAGADPHDEEDHRDHWGGRHPTARSQPQRQMTSAGDRADGVEWSGATRRQVVLEGLRRELESMAPRVRQVMRQTNARVFAGDTHAENKIVSLFEPSTEVIRKGKAGKPTEFGKIVKSQEAENQIVVAYEVYDRRPSDSDLLLAAIETHQATLGCTPHLVAADAGFYSAKNEAAAKAKGVK